MNGVSSMVKVAAIGECMLELSKRIQDKSGNAFEMAYGGDTLNTALYLSRLGLDVSYVTALGDDPYSNWMLEQWRKEGINCDAVVCEPGAVPGLYIIENQPDGERSFCYWRDNAPAKRLLDDVEQAEQIFQQLVDFDWLYLSGITLSIFSGEARQRLYDFLKSYRQQGGKVAFDPNYRPRGWHSPEDAKQAFASVLTEVDLALPTFDDEVMLYGDSDEASVVQRMQDLGVAEVVVKSGAEGCLVVNASGRYQTVSEKVDQVVDTTGAGDSFNAGYLSARFNHVAEAKAAREGHRVAATVIQHKGAIVPISAIDIDTIRSHS